ncbi:MAG: NAD-dependent epimerase/dehydratase family protein [Anaerolineales bacterium]|nr:NAD-dependent epimerase/dehydratase family protein [Anaerolineales bacterium]
MEGGGGESAQHLVEALRGRVQHFLHCGTIWAHGPSVIVPTTEEQARRAFGAYGIQKAAIEGYLLREARLSGFPATVLMPGHIVGPGWVPLNPAGHFNPAVFETLARGEELLLPNLGMETVHHVHADDVALAFLQAMAHWSTSVGQNFHVVSPAAITLRGYAEAVASWFGREARLRFLPWDEWAETVTPEEAQATWGPHRSQSQLQHCQGTAIDQLPTPLFITTSRSGGGNVVDRAGAYLGLNVQFIGARVARLVGTR